MRSRTRWGAGALMWGSAATLALAAPGCGEQLSEPRPTPPQGIEQVAAAFEAPTGQFDASTVDFLVEDATRALDATDKLDDLKLLRDILGGLAGEEGQEQALRVERGALTTAEQPIKVGDIDIEGEGFLQVTHICHGWEGEATPNEAENGTLGLTINFSDTGIDPVIWGGFKGCKLDLEGVNAELDPKIVLYVGDNFQFGQSDNSTIVFSLADGRMAFDERELDLDLDFRVGAGEGVEILLPTERGPVVVSPTATGVTFRAANGTWTCDLEARQCQSDGETIDY